MESSTNLGRVSLVPRGEYDPETAYERLDVVRYGGSSWLVLRSVQGVTPEDGADYMLLAEQGAPGNPGQKGATFTPSVSSDGELSWTNDGGLQNPTPINIKGTPGSPGQKGEGFTVKGYFPTLDALEAAVPEPEEGSNYGVGTSAPYDIYTWDAVHLTWVNNGTIQGPPGTHGEPGPGVDKIERTGGTGAAGTHDTYTVTLTDGRTSRFCVYNGADGAAAEICPIVLTAEGWTEEPYMQQMAVSSVLEDEEKQIIHAVPAVADEEAWAKAGIRCVGQGNGTLTFIAREKPEEDLTGWVAVQDAGNASAGMSGADVATDEEVREMLDEIFGKTDLAEPEPPVMEPEPAPGSEPEID